MWDEGLHGEAGLAPGSEPPAQRVDLVESGGEAKGYPGARRLSGLRAVEDHFAVWWEQMVGMPQDFGSDPARSRDPVRSRLDVQRRSQVDDHEVVAGVQPLFELHHGDASLS